jgi:hypothetical protein
MNPSRRGLTITTVALVFVVSLIVGLGSMVFFVFFFNPS